MTDGADTEPQPAKGSETLSYEQARDKLAAVVKRLEAGGLTLEQSLELWERGERLATVCGEWLDGARAAGKGVRTRTRSRLGLVMVSEYVSYAPPRNVGMTMVAGMPRRAA